MKRDRERGASESTIAQAARYLHYALRRSGKTRQPDPYATLHELLFTLCPPSELQPASRHWRYTTDGDPHGLALYERHYSCYQYQDGRRRRLFIGPGEKLVLLTSCARALFVWRKFLDDSGQSGVCCAVFRNETGQGNTDQLRSSMLIREAMEIAWRRWSGERLYTFVDTAKVRSQNPGACFLLAGWRRAGITRGGLLILEATP
jgi:hypothetical protein